MGFKDKEKERLYYRWYYENNKDRHDINSHRSKLKKFGLTVEQYDALLIKQDFRCALCRQHISEFKNRLSVDHCHETGRIRGLLCMACNTSLGKLGDTPAAIRRVSDYVNASI